MRLPAILLLSALSSLAALASDVSSTLLGRVTDSSGAGVPGAKVHVRNLQTNASRDAETNPRGEYVVALLSPGVYTISAEAQGFRRLVQTGVKLDVNQTARLDFTLQIGDLKQEIVVTAAALLLQSDTSTLGHVTAYREVTQLPLNERNFLALALLGPGVHMSADGSQLSSQGVAISVNGAREQANNYLLDGVDNNDPLINLYSVLPSVDAIQEFKVQSGNSSAEFGRNSGGQINVVLRSGTNQLHGSLFEFFRNRHLDAKNFFDLPDCATGLPPGRCGPVPRFDRNQFGGTIGGPMRRDKSFIFLSYESLRLRQATTREAAVPSQVQRNAALAAVPPSMRNSAGLAVLNLLPPANAGTDLNLSNRFVSSPVIRDMTHQLLVKLDHTLNSRNAFSGHYGFLDGDRFNPFDPLLGFTSLPGYGSLARNRGHNLAATWTAVLGSRVAQQLRFGFNRRTGSLLQEHSGTSKSQELGFPDVLTNSVDLGFPNVLIAGFDGIGEPRNLPQDRHDDTFSWSNQLAWSPAFQGGRHQFKFGTDLRYLRVDGFLDAVARGEWFFLGVFTGDPLQDLLRGLPAFALGAKGDTFLSLRSTQWNLYAQDDLRLNPRLTLNLGLRWEYNTPPVDTQDRLSAPDLSTNSATCAPRPDCQFIVVGASNLPRAGFRADRNNFAPRIGFAWRPSDHLVLRAAYGLFYDVGVLNVNILPRFNPPFYEVPLFLNFGASTIQTILSQPPVPVPPVAIRIDPLYHDAYLQQWNLGVQYAPVAESVLELAYVGSKGTALALQRNVNQAAPGTGAFPFPQFGPINQAESSGSSSYHALQLRAEKRYRAGLSLLGAYTWSKSLDNASSVFGTSGEPGFPQDSMNLNSERGLSNFHTKHRFVLSSIYKLPFGPRRRWLHDAGLLRELLRDWRVSEIVVLQSGRPFTVNRGIDQSQSGTANLGIFADRPNVIADPFVPGPVPGHPDPLCAETISNGGRAADQVRTAQTWFNPCAFAGAGLAFGNAGRNFLIGPDLKNLDFSAAREFTLGRAERRFQLRADFFNFFNRPNLDLPDRTFDSRTFSQVRSASANGNKPPRQIQLAVRYLF